MNPSERDTRQPSFLSARFSAQIIIVLLSAIILITGISFFVISASVVKKEDEDVLEGIVQVKRTLNNAIEQLDIANKSEADWTGMYEFARGAEHTDVADSLGPDTLRELTVDFALVYGQDGTLRQAFVADSTSSASLKIPNELVSWNPMKVRALISGQLENERGIVMLPDGPFIISMRPIRKSDLSGPPAGVLLMATQLDRTRIEGMRSLSDQRFDILPVYGDSASPGTFLLVVKALQTDVPVKTILSRDSMSADDVLLDADGFPDMVIRILQARPVYQEGMRSILWLLAGTALVALIALAILRIMIGRARTMYRLQSETERLYRSLMEASPYAITLIGLDGKIALANRQAADLAGYGEPSELIGLRAATLVAKEDLHVLRKHTERVLEGGISPYQRITIRKRDGVEFAGEGVIARVADENDRTAYILSMTRNASERIAREEENQRLFAETRERLDQLEGLRTIDKAIVWSFDLDYILAIILEQTCARLGMDAADILLYEESTQSLVFGAKTGFISEALSHTRLKAGEGFAGKVLRDRMGVFTVADLTTESEGFSRSPAFAGEGFVFYAGVSLIVKGEAKGVLEVFKRSRFIPGVNWEFFLEALAGQAAIALDNTALFNGMHKANQELRDAYEATIEGWASALEFRDSETEGHSRRVAEMSLRLAEVYGISGMELDDLRHGALLHDIGKIGVPDAILQKPGKLTAEEFEVMKQHPDIARNLLSRIPFLQGAIDIPYCHHERWDGSGYPRGLMGERIPFSARLFAVVDVWDALRSDRPYRKAWTDEAVFDHIEKGSGSHFDPKVVEAFLKLRSRAG
jgi:PAS domain S-box-containing protein